MIKECGIINRVLDGFAFKVPVLTRPQSLLAFKDFPNCCYQYTDADSFMKAVNEIRNNRESAKIKTEKAYQFVKDRHDWTTNYKKLKDIIEEINN